MNDHAHTIGLLISNLADRRLLTDFLQHSGYTVRMSQPLPISLSSVTDVSLLIADEHAARQNVQEILALKQQSAEIYLPLLILLGAMGDGAAWLNAGFDDVLYQPLSKAELSARLRVFLRVREQSSAQHQMHTELRALSARLESVREEERMFLARELHDESGQLLTALKIDLAMLQHLLAKGDVGLHGAQAIQQVQGAIELTNQVLASLRQVISQLRPKLLDDLGLVATLQWVVEEFEKRGGTVAQFSTNVDDMDLGHDRSLVLYRIAQESLTNVARHANATSVNVSLRAESGQLVLEVRDNGKGFTLDELSAHTSFGLMGMRERVLVLGGTFDIRGAPGEGATVTVRIPT